MKKFFILLSLLNLYNYSISDTCNVVCKDGTTDSYSSNCLAGTMGDCTPQWAGMQNAKCGGTVHIDSVNCGSKVNQCAMQCQSNPQNDKDFCINNSICSIADKQIYINAGDNCDKKCNTDQNAKYPGQCKWLCNTCIDRCQASGNPFMWCINSSICKDSEYDQAQEFIKAGDACEDNCIKAKGTTYPGQCKWWCKSKYRDNCLTQCQRSNDAQWCQKNAICNSLLNSKFKEFNDSGTGCTKKCIDDGNEKKFPGQCKWVCGNS